MGCEREMMVECSSVVVSRCLGVCVGVSVSVLVVVVYSLQAHVSDLSLPEGGLSCQ